MDSARITSPCDAVGIAALAAFMLSLRYAWNGVAVLVSKHGSNFDLHAPHTKRLVSNDFEWREMLLSVEAE